MSHGPQVCQFGVTHARCRCPGPHTTTHIQCDVPEQHGAKMDDDDRPLPRWAGPTERVRASRLRIERALGRQVRADEQVSETLADLAEIVADLRTEVRDLHDRLRALEMRP